MANIQAIHECLFCSQTFATTAAKDDHTLEHFAQETCVECNRNLIRIGGSLYTKHDSTICNKMTLKSEDGIQMPALIHSEFVLSSTLDDFSTTENVTVKEEQPETFNENSNDSMDWQNYSPDFEMSNFEADPHCPSINDSQELSTLYQTESLMEVNVEAEVESMETTESKNATDKEHKTKSSKKSGSKTNSSKHKERSSQSDKIDGVKRLELHQTESTVKQKLKKEISSDMQCDLCDRLLKTDQSYREHMRRRHDQHVTNVRCKRCRTVFNKEISLQEHKCSKSENEKMACQFCGHTFVQRVSLDKHIVRMHSVTNVYCKICQINFDDQKKYNLHKDACVKAAKEQSSKKRGPCECDVCGRKMISKYTLKKHQVLKHSPSNRLFCDVCGKIFTVKLERDEHQLQCKIRRKLGTLRLSGTFECDICHRVIKTKSELRRHMIVKHIPGGDEFKCKTCGKTFLKKTSHEIHNVICKGRNKSYKELVPCEACGKIVTRGALKTHAVAFHSAPGTVFCRTCFKIFPNNDELLIHRSKCKKNQLIQPRECKICKKTLSSAGTFSRHNLTHHSKGVIFCRNCVKRFKSMEELKAHAPDCSLKRKLQKYKKQNQLTNDKIG